MQIPNIPKQVLDALHERGMKDAQIEQLSPKRLFQEYCEWHGMIGWSDTLWTAVTELQEAAR